MHHFSCDPKNKVETMADPEKQAQTGSEHEDVSRWVVRNQWFIIPIINWLSRNLNTSTITQNRTQLCDTKVGNYSIKEEAVHCSAELSFSAQGWAGQVSGLNCTIVVFVQFYIIFSLQWGGGCRRRCWKISRGQPAAGPQCYGSSSGDYLLKYVSLCLENSLATDFWHDFA